MGIMSLISRMFGGGASEEAATEKVKVSEAVSVSSSVKGKPRERREKKERSPRSNAPASAVSAEELEAFVEYVAKALVDYPDELSVATEMVAGVRQIKINCRATDRGKIIGRKGKTIIALRALVAGAAGRTQERVTVEIVDDENSLHVRKDSDAAENAEVAVSC